MGNLPLTLPSPARGEGKGDVPSPTQAIGFPDAPSLEEGGWWTFELNLNAAHY